MGAESAGATIFGLFYQALVEELFLEPLGESLYAGFTSYPPLPSRVVKRIFIDNQTGWLEKIRPQDLLRKSFRNAVSRGQNLIGSDPKKWKWGEIHTAEFRHPLATRSKFLEALYEVGPIPISGAWDTINFAGWSQAHPFHVSAGMSLRQVVDMTQPPQVAAASPMGASAHFFSSHYKDQTRAWLHGRSFRPRPDRGYSEKRISHGYLQVGPGWIHLTKMKGFYVAPGARQNPHSNDEPGKGRGNPESG